MKKEYKKLYSRDSKGKIRIWWLEQFDGKYRTHAGVQDGKIITSDWTQAEGKNVGRANETTPTEQATSEINSKYEKQLKTGYSETLKNVDKGCAYVEPMLAKHYKDYADKINFAKENWGIQRKLNGNRCVATADALKTRKGEVYVCVTHINKALEKFFKKYPDAVLDGELYNRELRQTLNELSKLVRRTVHITAEDLNRSEEIVEYHIYDGWGFDGLDKDAPYSNRKE
jgi:DNA ligase-1